MPHTHYTANMRRLLVLLALPSAAPFQHHRSTRHHLPRQNVFSGIVEEMGTVVSLQTDKEMLLWDGTTGEGTELIVDGPVASDGAYVGCSIAVNGVCLTATRINIDNQPKFSLTLAPETLRRTNLGALKENDKVNLERSLAADGRNSGHYVQGHVDTTGKVLKKTLEGDSLWVEIEVNDPDLLACIVPKGYVAVDGTSLTVCDCVEIKILRAFVLNRRGVLHAIDAAPARWRGDAGSSPLDGARTVALSPR